MNHPRWRPLVAGLTRGVLLGVEFLEDGGQVPDLLTLLGVDLCDNGCRLL